MRGRKQAPVPPLQEATGVGSAVGFRVVRTGVLVLALAAVPTLVFAQTDGEVIAKQYDDGSVYEGTFKDGRQDGTGT